VDRGIAALELNGHPEALETPGCRACGAPGLASILDLGEQPLANSLRRPDELLLPEPRYPLRLALCPSCSLVQIFDSLPPEALFSDYPYFSSVIPSLVEHAREIVLRLLESERLDSDSTALEIASNDGYLLQNYVAAGVPVLGIEPARNIAPAAEARGVRTVCEFFGLQLAEELRAKGKLADVLHANNVMAHVPDLNGVLQGIARVLSPGGVAVIETPYVRDLVERLEFDTIYHEHLSYYSLTSLDRAFRRNGLSTVGVERIPIHGGSLRVFAGPGDGPPTGEVARLLAEERDLGMDQLDYFLGFAAAVDDLLATLRDLLAGLKSQGHRIAAYGAAAKGATMLNACGIGTETIDFVADRSEYKQGRFMPGVHLPVVAPERLLQDRPDEVLLLTWNFADEILEQQAAYRAEGGRFVIPVPEPRIV
jgi:SAM-dependent methyltransferase